MDATPSLRSDWKKRQARFHFPGEAFPRLIKA
jgi:hypothetical protein